MITGIVQEYKSSEQKRRDQLHPGDSTTHFYEFTYPFLPQLVRVYYHQERNQSPLASSPSKIRSLTDLTNSSYETGLKYFSPGFNSALCESSVKSCTFVPRMTCRTKKSSSLPDLRRSSSSDWDTKVLVMGLLVSCSVMETYSFQVL